MPDMTLANIANANSEKLRRERIAKRNNTIETIKDFIGAVCTVVSILGIYILACCL